MPISDPSQGSQAVSCRGACAVLHLAWSFRSRFFEPHRASDELRELQNGNVLAGTDIDVGMVRRVMLDGPARLALFCAVGLALCVAQSSPCRAQEGSGNEGSTTSGPTLEQYLKEAGPDVTVVQHGALKIGGHSVTCGKR